MSLKAKLEAVIYAAEEPVTLAQLTALFAADALDWKALQQAASAEQAAEEAADENLSLVDGGLHYLATAAGAEDMSAPSVSAEGETGPQAASEPGAEPAATEAEPTTEPEGAEAAESAASDEAEARRAARQREREARAVIRQLLDELVAEYASENRGVEIREIAGGYRMATKPEYHDAVRMFVKSLKPALRLSLPALETLAVIAYKQPVTAPEVNEIRGVDSSGVFGSLLARKLIATAGRKPVIGRPILYKTTREFLLRFGLKDVTELPSMEEFEKMAATELDEPEMAGEGDAAAPADPKPSLAPELEFDGDGANEPKEEPDHGDAPESVEMPAAMAVSPEPAEMAATPAEPTPAEAAPAAPFPN
jgi:segregation and condensation protein B